MEYLGPKRRRLLDQSWAGGFHDYLLKQLPVGELATEFRNNFGRPTKDFYVALGALILQQLHDLTDQQTTEEQISVRVETKGSRQFLVGQFGNHSQVC